RCAERRGEPSARTRGKECLDIVLVTAEGGGKKMPNARSHLDGRPLPAECEPGAHRQHATKEFHRDQDRRRRRRWFVTQASLAVGDAASLCFRREFSDKP